MKIFYCDGSTRGKNKKGADNIGGWGIVCLNETEEQIIDITCRENENTTNNREELKALLYCLDYADNEFPNERCIIYSDSAYVVNMFNDWIHSWSLNGWRNSKKQEVENLDLVLQIYEHAKQGFYHCEVKKCSGHAGEIGNEIADKLARGQIKKAYEIIKYNDLEIQGKALDWIEYVQEEIDFRKNTKFWAD